jgi:hypothetical protein
MQIKGKKALLLINNFSAHELAVKKIKEVNSLINTKIMWLLLNITFIY